MNTHTNTPRLSASVYTLCWAIGIATGSAIGTAIMLFTDRLVIAGSVGAAMAIAFSLVLVRLQHQRTDARAVTASTS